MAQSPAASDADRVRHNHSARPIELPGQSPTSLSESDDAGGINTASASGSLATESCIDGVSDEAVASSAEPIQAEAAGGAAEDVEEASTGAGQAPAAAAVLVSVAAASTPAPSDEHTAEVTESARSTLAARLASARAEAEKHSLRVWRGVEDYRAGDFARAELAVRAYWQAWRRWMQQSAAHDRATAGHLARVAEAMAGAARVLACSFPVDAQAVQQAARDAELGGDGEVVDARALARDASGAAGRSGDGGATPRTSAAVAMVDALRELGAGSGPVTSRGKDGDGRAAPLGGTPGTAPHSSTLFRAAYAASDLSGSQSAGKLHVFSQRLRSEALEHTLASAATSYRKQCDSVAVDAEGLLTMLHGAAEEVNAAWAAMADAYGARLPDQTPADRERRQRRLASTAVQQAGRREQAALDFKDDPWAAELVYARGCRGLLACRRAFVRGFAALFEKFRRAEVRRSKATSTALELLAELQGQMLGPGVRTDAAVAAARDVDTFGDFTARVESEAFAAYRKAGSKTEGGQGRGQEGKAELSTPTAGGKRTKSFLSFVSLCPADVPSPLVSPLVLRWGRGWRRSGGLFKGWTPCTLVLTMAGMLHVFSDDADLGTNQGIVKRGRGGPTVVGHARPAARAPNTSLADGPGTVVRSAGSGAASGGGGRPRADSPGGSSFPPGPPFAGLADVPDAQSRDRVKRCQAPPEHSICLRGCVPGNVASTPEGSAPSTVLRSKGGKPSPTAHIHRRTDLDQAGQGEEPPRAGLEVKLVKPGMLFSSSDSLCLQFEKDTARAWATALHRLLVNLAQADGLVDSA